MNDIDVLAEGKRVFSMEIKALDEMKEALDGTFVRIVNMIVNCKGKVVITGMGKPGHIAKKLAATFSSLGTPSFFLHPGEAMHGDLGMVSNDDLVIAISYSGESDEIIRILPNIKMIGAKIIAISGNKNSTLVKYSDIAQIFPSFEEACHLKLAPTSSTTVALAYGDALAVAASEIYGFTKENFGLFHPAGSLGKKLLYKTKDLMMKDEKNPVIKDDCDLKDAIFIISRKGMGMVSVIDESKKIIGIITDGDLRRLLENEVNVYGLKVKDVMSKNPFVIQENVMAVEALKKFKERKLRCSPVINESNEVVGCITDSIIINTGIIL